MRTQNDKNSRHTQLSSECIFRRKIAVEKSVNSIVDNCTALVQLCTTKNLQCTADNRSHAVH